MKIYINKDENGQPVGVLLAETQDRAELAWAAMGDPAFTVEEIDPAMPGYHGGLHGVVFLLTSKKKHSSEINTRHGFVFRKWRRGL